MAWFFSLMLTRKATMACGSMVLFFFMQVMLRPAGRNMTCRWEEICGLCKAYACWPAVHFQPLIPTSHPLAQHNRRQRMRRQLDHPAVAAIALHRQRRRGHVLRRAGAIAGARAVGCQQLAAGVLGQFVADQAYTGW